MARGSDDSHVGHFTNKMTTLLKGAGGSAIKIVRGKENRKGHRIGSTSFPGLVIEWGADWTIFPARTCHCIDEEPPVHRTFSPCRFFRGHGILWGSLIALCFLLSPCLSSASSLPPLSQAPLPDRLGISLFDAHETAPEIEAPDLSGQTLKLSDFRGKVILLNFWATWCEPCRKEIPALQVLQKKLSGKPFVIVSVAMDRHLGHIPPFVRKYHIRYPVMEGRKGRVDSRYYGLGLPQSYVIDANGYLVGRVMGGRDWASSDAMTYFSSLLPGRPDRGHAGKGEP